MPTETPQKDTAGTIIAAILILIGAVAWWDTTTMGDPDSYVFPRAVIITMVAFCLLLIIVNLIRPATQRDESEGGAGSYRRRLLLVVVMLVGAGVMPFMGFFISGLVVFFALTWTAMYDPWTRFRLVVYPLSGVAIVTGFYLLFAELLLVPLPTGALFD